MVPYAPEIVENKEMLALLTPFQEFGQEKLLVKVGSTDAKLEGDRAIVRSQPTTLGTLIARAMMEKTRADFAMVNAGGVRDSLPAGELNYKDILKVHPFGNTIVTVDLTGAEVLNYLAAAAKMSPGSGAFPQFAGIELTISKGAIAEAKIRSAPIDRTKTYRLAVNNFVAAGGDGYPRLNTHPSYVDTGFVDADVLRSYISSRSPLKASDYTPTSYIVRN
jgi:5'-nucleotidase/UDP-sugar diphosphatase